MKVNITRRAKIESSSTQSTMSSNGRNNKSNNITSNNYQRVDKQKESNTPYKITINTRYDKCRKPQGDKINESKDENTSKTHIHKLTREERQKYARGLRPSAAQREMDAYAKLDNKTKDSMIEVIDKTKYPLENNNIKLKQNKVTLINKKKIVGANDPRQKYSRGIREKKEELIGEIEVNEEPSRIRNTNQNQNQNKEIQLISNKRNIIRNKKPLSPLPDTRRVNHPPTYDPKGNLTTKVEKTTTRINISSPDTNNKNNLRHNTVSHKIVDIKKGERKPYILNERKTDIISFQPSAFRKYSLSNKWDDTPYKSDKNHSIVTIRNVTREYKTVVDVPSSKIHHQYNISHDPNLKNTGSHKIDATKKEPKKEVVVHPRKLIVIKSVIPNRRHLTETKDENSNQKKNQNLYVRKYETDKKTPKNLDKRLESVRENKYYQPKSQNQPNIYQPRQRIDNKPDNKDIINTRINRRINVNEPKKEINTNRYTNPIITKPQTTQQVPSTQSTQSTRIRREYQKPIEKPSQDKNQPQISKYTSRFPKKETQVQPRPTRANQPTTIKPPVQTKNYNYIQPKVEDANKYSRRNQPLQITSQHRISSSGNTNIQPINRRQERKLDNNDVKQIVYTKGSNTGNVPSNEKTKNYVVSNAGFVQNKTNNDFVISKANKSTSPTVINNNINKNENDINKETKENEINKDIKKEEIITQIDVKIESKEEKPQESQESQEPQEPQEQKEQKEEKEEEKKEEPQEQEEIEEENENIQNNENIEDKDEIIKIESPVEQNIEKQENINEKNIEQNEPQQETENKYSDVNIPDDKNIEDTTEPKHEFISVENPNEKIEININKEEQNNEEINQEENNQIKINEQEQEPEKENIEQNDNIISNEYKYNMDINNIEHENEEGGEEGEEQIENVEVYKDENINNQQQNMEGEEGEEEQIENGEEYVNINENGEEYENINENGEEYENINENGEEYMNINENGEEYENINQNGEEYEQMNEEENGENYEEEVGEEEIQEIDGGEEVEGEEEGVEEIEDDGVGEGEENNEEQ